MVGQVPEGELCVPWQPFAGGESGWRPTGDVRPALRVSASLRRSHLRRKWVKGRPAWQACTRTCESPPQGKRSPEAVGVEALAGCPSPASPRGSACGSQSSPRGGFAEPRRAGRGSLSSGSGAVFLWLLPKRPGPSASLPDPARPRRLHRMEEPLSSSWDRAWSPALWTRTRQRHSSTCRGPKPWAVGASLSPLTGSFSASPPLLSWHILGLPSRFRVAQSRASGRSPGEHAGVKGRGRCLQRAAAEPQSWVGPGWVPTPLVGSWVKGGQASRCVVAPGGRLRC